MGVTMGVYRIVNAESGKTYIGSSCNVDKRLAQHKRRLAAGKHCNPHLQSAFNKYGAGAFTYEALVSCERAKLAEREQSFIDAYFDHDMPLYNQQPSHASGVGFTVSAETRAKMSAALRGRTLSPETRAKMSAAMMGNTYNVGRTLSPEHRAKLRGRTMSPETRAKLLAANLGRTMSPEHRAKLSAANRGRTLSPEHRAKMSAAWIVRIAKKRAMEVGNLWV